MARRCYLPWARPRSVLRIKGLLNQHLWLRRRGDVVTREGLTNSQANASPQCRFQGLIESLINLGGHRVTRNAAAISRPEPQGAVRRRGASTVHELFGQPRNYDGD